MIFVEKKDRTKKLCVHYRRFNQDGIIVNPRNVVVFALEIWRNYLYGDLCDIFMDHQGLKYIFTQEELNLS